MDHPTHEEIAQFVNNELGMFKKRGMEKHIALCDDCRAAMLNIMQQTGKIEKRSFPATVAEKGRAVLEFFTKGK